MKRKNQIKLDILTHFMLICSFAIFFHLFLSFEQKKVDKMSTTKKKRMLFVPGCAALKPKHIVINQMICTFIVFKWNYELSFRDISGFQNTKQSFSSKNRTLHFNDTNFTTLIHTLERWTYENVHFSSFVKFNMFRSINNIQHSYQFRIGARKHATTTKRFW